MNLQEAIIHAKLKSKETRGKCAKEHEQLAIWLTDLQELTKNGYGNFTTFINNHTHDYALASMQGRLASNPNIKSEDLARMVTKDVNAMMLALKLNYAFTTTTEKYKPVLVRNDENKIWNIDYFVKVLDTDIVTTYECLNKTWTYCISYEGNEHLLGTPNSPKLSKSINK